MSWLNGNIEPLWSERVLVVPPAEHALATQDVVYRTDLLEDRVARRLKLGISPAHSVLLERSFDLGPSKAPCGWTRNPPPPVQKFKSDFLFSDRLMAAMRSHEQGRSQWAVAQ